MLCVSPLIKRSTMIYLLVHASHVPYIRDVSNVYSYKYRFAHDFIPSLKLSS